MVISNDVSAGAPCESTVLDYKETCLAAMNIQDYKES